MRHHPHVTMSFPHTSNLSDAKSIHDRAMEKLEEQQKEKAMLEHSLQSDYLAYRKLVGRESAENFINDVMATLF